VIGSASASRTTRQSDLGGWILRAGVAAFFVAFGWDKFNSAPGSEWVGIFRRIGFGQWFRIMTGIIEVGGAALYIFPLTCRIGAALLATTMVGAIIAHCTVLRDPLSSIMPAAALLATVMIALRELDAPIDWKRRKQ
jgi:uncharacterized membrane protein YphA (DoxX/SURF4 family)